MRNLMWGLFLGGVLWLTACSTPPSPTMSLVKMTEHFSERMRWQDYGFAASFVAAEEREGFLEAWRDAEDLHVVDTKIESIEMLGESKARVNMAIDYYLLPSTTIRKIESSQEWAYRTGEGVKMGNWELVSGLPEVPPQAHSSQKDE